MRKIVQIKGANASGKTTICKQLQALEPSRNLLIESASAKPGFLKGKPYATLLPSLKLALVGEYPVTAKGGGCDLIHTMDELKGILDKLVAEYPQYSIVFEGVMISTTLTTYGWMQQYTGLEPLVVMLMSDLDGAIRRLSQRRGETVTADMFTQLQPKVERMQTAIKRHSPEHLRFIYVDQIPLEDMVWEFLAAIGYEP